jgi:hypothetical protein
MDCLSAARSRSNSSVHGDELSIQQACGACLEEMRQRGCLDQVWTRPYFAAERDATALGNEGDREGAYRFSVYRSVAKSRIWNRDGTGDRLFRQ